MSNARILDSRPATASVRYAVGSARSATCPGLRALRRGKTSDTASSGGSPSLAILRSAMAMPRHRSNLASNVVTPPAVSSTVNQRRSSACSPSAPGETDVFRCAAGQGGGAPDLALSNAPRSSANLEHTAQLVQQGTKSKPPGTAPCEPNTARYTSVADHSTLQLASQPACSGFSDGTWSSHTSPPGCVAGGGGAGAYRPMQYSRKRVWAGMPPDAGMSAGPRRAPSARASQTANACGSGLRR